MCHVCSLEKNANPKMTYGIKGKITTRKMFRVYSNRTAYIKLCYVHDIEMHIAGEERFLMAHPLLAKDLAANSSKYTSS